MNLSDVMAEIGTKLEAIDGLRVTPFSAARITPPAALVSLPTTYVYDATYARGCDTLTLEVLVVVGKASDRASTLALAAYADGSGDSSVKAAVEAEPNTAYDTAHVVSAEFDVATVAGTDYLAATFSIDITGQGG